MPTWTSTSGMRRTREGSFLRGSNQQTPRGPPPLLVYRWCQGEGAGYGLRCESVALGVCMGRGWGGGGGGGGLEFC